jgi:hypothetical protein
MGGCIFTTDNILHEQQNKYNHFSFCRYYFSGGGRDYSCLWRWILYVKSKNQNTEPASQKAGFFMPTF